MKKLLTVLITLVIAVCLVNLNRNNAIANDNDNPEEIDYCLYLGDDDVLYKHTLSGDTPLDGNTAELNRIGITHTGNTLSLSKSLRQTSSNYGLLSIDNNATLIIENNITLSNNSGYSTIGYDQTLALNINIQGGGNTLTLNNTAGRNFIFYLNNHNVVLNNVKVICSGNHTNIIFDAKNLKLEESSTLDIKNSNTNGGALRVQGQFEADDVEILGSASIDSINFKPATKNAVGIFQVDDGTGKMVNARYIVIRAKQDPEPTPSPSKKDESCEKVIGPTWHWNNDKGVCEDYGVVGTSTR